MTATDDLNFLGEVETALAEGRVPRARRPLKEAARRLTETGDAAAAARAMRLLGLLELRSGDPRRALNAARAGLRMVRADEAEHCAGMLQLISRICLTAGERERAVDSARRSLKVARRESSLAEAQLCLAEAEVELGRLGEAATAAEEALELAQSAEGDLQYRSQRVAAQVLLRSGCPTAAARILNGGVDSCADPREQIRILLHRGNSRRVLGRPDQAARDFRAAARIGRELPDRRYEAHSLGALATVELIRAREENNAARAGRAEAALDRAIRIAKRFKDPYLQETLEQLQRIAGNPPADARDAQSAARELVQLAQETESTLLVDACVAEVERLAALPPGSPAYAAPPLPLRFTPA